MTRRDLESELALEPVMTGSLRPGGFTVTVRGTKPECPSQLS